MPKPKNHYPTQEQIRRRRVVGAGLGIAAAVAAVRYGAEPVNLAIDKARGLESAVSASTTSENGTSTPKKITHDPNVRYVTFTLGTGHNSLSFPAAKYAYDEDPLEAAKRIMDYIPGMTEDDKKHYNVQPGEITFAVNTKTHEVVPFEQAPPPPSADNG